MVRFNCTGATSETKRLTKLLRMRIGTASFENKTDCSAYNESEKY